jgi:Ca2+-transporting ATPase
MTSASNTTASLPGDDTSMPWHALSLEETASRLGTSLDAGLDRAQATARHATFGFNVLHEPPAEPWWRKLLRQFQEIVIWILLVAAVIAGAMGDWADTAAILAIVVVNAIIGFLQEERAQRSLAALQRISAPLARVMRGGKLEQLPARDLVPGDRVALDAGDHVPADARLIEGFGLRVQEAALTGESEPVEKQPGGPLPLSTPLGDRRSLVHSGTVVAAGRGAAIVVATGMATELGRIASLLARSPAETTPLQRRLAELGRLLIVVCLVVVAVIFAIELARGGRLAEVLLRAVSLAVAAVPEGLPTVVTLVLAVGLQRMVARNALVRRLPSVETLGSVTVICSDKTGTLTRNEMTIREIATATERYHVSGAGYAPQGEFRRADGGPAVIVGTQPDLTRLLAIGARCNNAVVRPEDGAGWGVVGDPTEGALVVAAMKAGISVGDSTEPIEFEIPFDSDRKRMSVVVRQVDGSRRMETKGATEAVLAQCVAELRQGLVVPLTADRRREILSAAAQLADRALRVLSLAYRDLQEHEPLGGAPDEHERDLVHVGLVGMIDPPRDEAREAVRTCRSAGIRPVMITGDHPATALAIGRELGLTDGAGRAVTGADLDALADDALAEVVESITVYARVTAEHKLRIVRAWQRRGQVVAMTGDGVNDAPAVKAADIGIAMGVTGTDVTKEASDMVLTDDNFASIVSAIEEGRSIYDNVQKFVHYLLSCNAGEVMLMFVAAVAGWPAPLAAIQILWLNLVTDGLPALALGLEPPECDIMRRAPRPPKEPVVTMRRGLVILAHGALMAAVTLGGFWCMWRGSTDTTVIEHAQAMTFCTAALAQLFFALACRSDRRTAIAVGFFRNPALLAAITISVLLQVVVVTLPFTRHVFEVKTNIGHEWLLVVALALVPAVVIEAGKRLWSGDT